MTYQQIKSFINTYIVQNGVNAITGAQLNTILNELADYKGFDSVFVTTLPAGSDATVTVQGMTLELGIPKGADGRDGQNAVNPFKGWFTTSNIPTTGQEGAYCNVMNTQTQTVTIYRWDATQNAFVDTGEVPDTATGETFASSETLQQVAIDNSHLVNPTNSFDQTQPVLAQAEDVMQLKAKLEGVTEEKVQIVSGTNFFDGYVDGLTGGWGQSSSNKVLVLPVEGVKRVRFLGTTIQSSETYLGYSFGTLTSGDAPDSTLSNFSPLNYCYAEYEHTGENVAKEYNLIVPEGATWLAVSYRTQYVAGKFYCYMQKQLDDEIFLHPSILRSDSYKSMDYNVLSNGNWGYNVDVKHALINVEGVKTITCRALFSNFNFAFLSKSIKPVSGEFSGAILISNGNYRYDLSGGQQIDVSVPYGAKYLSFTLGDSSSVKGEFSLKYFTNFKKGLNKVDIPITLVGGTLGASTGTGGEYYEITQAEYNKFCSNYMHEKLVSFNPLFDSITGFDADIANGTLTYHCFSENGRIYLGKTDDASKMPIGTTHIRLQLTFAEPQTVRKVNLTLHTVLKEENYEIIKSYGPANKFMEFGSFAKFFSIEIVRPRIPSEADNGAVYYPDAQDRDYTNAYIYLPKGYSNVGKPSKVLLNFHGTTTFNLNQSALAEEQDLQRQFLAKCGYAVIDVCTDSYYTFVNYDYGTGASYGGYASNFPTPLAYECWSKVVEYCLDTYNLDPDNIFVISKSSGGLNCINFINKFSGVKIKAAAMIASSIDIFCNIRASYVGSINNFLMQIGCLNPNVHQMNIGVGAVNPEDKAYFETNEAKIQAYNPILAKMSNNFDAHQFMEAVLNGIYSTEHPNTGDDSPMYDNMELSAMVGACSVHSDVPTKMWHAVDDDNVPFTQSRWYKEMCVRGGSHVELRQWPALTGRHYFDSFVPHDDGTGVTYTPTLIDYTTQFGEIVQANPVYAEIVDWLNRW